MVLDLSDAIPQAANYDNPVDVAAIEVFETAVLLWFNTNVPNTGAARGVGLTTPNWHTMTTIKPVMMTILLQLAHNGTSTSTVYKRINVNINGAGTVGPEVAHTDRIIGLMSASNVTYRMYLRHYATPVFKYAKKNNIKFRVGRKAGADERYGHAGFDAAIYVTGMDTHERATADAVFQISIARAQTGGTQVSNALEVTKGRIETSNRTMMF